MPPRNSNSHKKALALSLLNNLTGAFTAKEQIALAVLGRRRKAIAVARRRALRSRGQSLYSPSMLLRQHFSAVPRSAAKYLFNVAEVLRTEAANARDIARARILYRAAMHGGSRAMRERARERVLLMMCQRHASAATSPSLRRQLVSGGFVCRLATPILRYAPTASLLSASPSSSSSAPPRGTTAALDGTLPLGMLHRLQRALAPGSPFWSEHGYRCGLHRSPFFSYVHSLEGEPRTGFDRVLRLLRQRAVDAGFPLAAKAKYVEWWAHCRPHGVGHQLHFDSDDEGQGGVRNPLLSSAFYLTGSGVGGPTLVTDQRMGEARLARRGWLVMPSENRYLLFDGKLLHGVVPGRGVAATPDGSGRRVSLMVAYWQSIEQRSSHVPAAARPFPYPSDKSPREGDLATATWPALFDWPAKEDAGGPSATKKSKGAPPPPPPAVAVSPAPVEPIWAAAEAERKIAGMPGYEECFQGLC